MSHSHTIGVLALQGAFAKHIEMLRSLGVKVKEVRYPNDLIECDALIIPGGESTVISRQMHFSHIEEALSGFAAKKPIFGTCAGLILMSHEIIGSEIKPYNLIDVTVERNAFGRQAESFQTQIELMIGRERAKQIPAIFIRAPRIKRCSPEVNILAKFEEEPILVQQGHHLAATFHPELTGNSTIHHYFLTLVRKSLSKE